MAARGKVTLKLLVDKEKNRVVFAQSEKDFVDILFSFLTLPLGTIVRLLDKQSGLGCLDNLYRSVETLDPLKHMQTEACSTMLLRPSSSAAVRHQSLTINIDDTKNPTVAFSCHNSDCCTKAICYVSSIQKTNCVYCKRPMNNQITWKDEVLANEVGGFVKEGSFIISDDLNVMPASKMHAATLLDKMRIAGWSALEERTLSLGLDEVLNLLRGALHSEMTLTNLCFPHKAVIDGAEKLHSKDLIQPVTETATELREEFMDLLLSFLTFPLGLVVKLLNKNSKIGCVDNLYKSIEALSSDDMESEECLNMLLSPKLSPFYGSKNQLLKVEEAVPREVLVPGCQICYWRAKFHPIFFLRSDFSSRQELNLNNYKPIITQKCEHGLEYSVLRELNPKRYDGSNEVGGGFVKGPGNFIITDDLCISPFSQNLIGTVNNPNGSSIWLVEKEELIGESQAVNLLAAALTSQTALSNAFSTRL